MEHITEFDADTIEEFAVKNRMSRGLVYKEINSGRLIARKIGTRTIITREDGAAWRRSLPKVPGGTCDGEATNHTD